VRLVIVVGLPLVTVFFRLPIWFTLLLLCVLAALLFFKPRLPEKRQPDPKQAWAVLMANFAKLQSVCEELQKSPADAEARSRFSTIEEKCRSILNSYSDADWGPDSEYAAKVRNEIAALSASVNAEGRNPAPAPGREAIPPPEIEPQVLPSASKGAAGQSESPLAALLDFPTSGKRPAPAPASEAAVLQAASPAPTAKPDVPPPAERPSPAPVSESKAERPGSPVPAVRPEVPVLAEEPSLTPASEPAVLQPESPAPAAKPEVPTPAERPSLTPASEAAAAQPESPAPAVKPDVPTPAERPSLTPASEPAVLQPASPAPAVKPDVPTPAEEPSLTPASEPAVLQPASPAPAVKPEVPPPAEEPGSPAPAVRLDVPCPAGRRLTPYLWLPGGVEDAAAFYVSVFRNSRIVGINRYPEGLHSGTWSVQTATVCLDGQDLMLLNGGSVHNLPGSFQLLVRCADQAEVDYFWERLPAGGGEEGTGGWLKDRFGISWQVMPDALLELLTDPNPQRAARATEAMLKMKKIDIATLHEAVGQPDAFASPMPG
jgi:predicted 3-demethylubiquinone-9 3-methyltransferase (glyoxalase superfamily)